ncbi:MAG: tyrosine-type recombinase/integrase [Rhodospirillales bacterium]|nr:tyrosine-type recombinase/integrase [Rhodospirillales bacterium]
MTADERPRFIEAAAHVKTPVDQTFVLTITHTGARISEILTLRALDVDLDAGSLRIRTLKVRIEHRREVPLPAELLRGLETVHRLREALSRRVKEPLWKMSQAMARRRAVSSCGRQGSRARRPAQGTPRQLRDRGCARPR